MFHVATRVLFICESFSGSTCRLHERPYGQLGVSALATRPAYFLVLFIVSAIHVLPTLVNGNGNSNGHNNGPRSQPQPLPNHTGGAAHIGGKSAPPSAQEWRHTNSGACATATQSPTTSCCASGPSRECPKTSALLVARRRSSAPPAASLAIHVLFFNYEYTITTVEYFCNVENF